MRCEIAITQSHVLKAVIPFAIIGKDVGSRRTSYARNYSSLLTRGSCRRVKPVSMRGTNQERWLWEQSSAIMHEVLDSCRHRN